MYSVCNMQGYKVFIGLVQMYQEYIWVCTSVDWCCHMHSVITKQSMEFLVIICSTSVFFKEKWPALVFLSYFIFGVSGLGHSKLCSEITPNEFREHTVCQGIDSRTAISTKSVLPTILSITLAPSFISWVSKILIKQCGDYFCWYG